MHKVLTGLLFVLTTLASAQDEPGRFPVNFINNAAVDLPDDSIHIVVLGMNNTLQWCHVDSLGIMRPVDPADASAPGHLSHNTTDYPDYSFTVAQAGRFTMPPAITGGRMYISLRRPLFIGIGENSWAGPRPDDPTDPNASIIYDWYEFTWVHGMIPFGGNTTQVDQFGFPMTVRLVQTTSGFDETIGITMSRQEVFEQYHAVASEPFRAIADAYRIVAPRSSAKFRAGGASGGYLDEVIERFWSHYTLNPFSMTRLHVTFSGQVEENRLRFTRTPAGVDGSGPFYLDKPTSADLIACAGAVARPGMQITELELGAELAAAFNRGVAFNPPDWYDTERYYVHAPCNEYAGFFHQIGLQQRAYGFPYDDVNDQSTVKVLHNSDPPTSLDIAISPLLARGSRVVSSAAGHLSMPFSVRCRADGRLQVAGGQPGDRLAVFGLQGRQIVPAAALHSLAGVSMRGCARGTYVACLMVRTGAVISHRFVW